MTSKIKSVLIGMLFLMAAFCPSKLMIGQSPDTLWTKTFGGMYYDQGYFVQQTSDGGYIITGRTRSFGAGLFDVWLIKTDANGDTMWTKTFGGSSDDEGYCVQQTFDGGYIVVGFTTSFSPSGIWLIRTDSNGDSLWTKTYGGSIYDRGSSVAQTFDGGFIITGYTWIFFPGHLDLWIIKTDFAGDILWTKTLGGIADEKGYSVQQTSGGGYVIAGTISVPFNDDFLLIKTNIDGDTIWTRNFGGSSYDRCYTVQQTSDGGFIIAGETHSFGAGSGDVWLIKTNSFGDTLWTKTFGGTSGEEGRSVQQTSDGGYIIAGSRAFDVWLIKTDMNGDTLWTKTLGGDSADYGMCVQQTTDNGYIICGSTASFSTGYYDVWLIKVAHDVVGIGEEAQPVINYYLQQNYPNPFNSITNIHYSIGSKQRVLLKVYDLVGKEIATLVNEEKSAGAYTVAFDASKLSSGIYFYKLRAGDFIEAKKMILMR